uniref:Reverse transcriptase domain-containing protein n=1 Tax=Tanacetum cinerariifolium TaxID=118510 RepID=A0A699KD86_TANCI|nr:reverse transcriptase domain-containing protein [Tanacetum cinerariifolium]
MFSLMSTMPPTMATQSAGRPATTSRGGGMGGRAGKGGGRTKGRSGDHGDGGQEGGQGNGRNQNGNAFDKNLRVYTLWMEMMKSVQDMSRCKDSQKVKYTAGLFVGKAFMWWNSQIHTQGRESAVGMPWEDFKTLTREDFYPSNEMQKLKTKLWNHVMVKAGHVTYTDRFHELARLVPHLVTPKSKRIKRYVYGLVSHIRGMVAVMDIAQKEKKKQNGQNLAREWKEYKKSKPKENLS